MDDQNITMEEYIRLEEERSKKCEKVFNWETARYGKIWYDEDIHDLRFVENEFLAIVFNDNLTSNEMLFCEPTVSSLNDNEIDFRISFDEFDDEDYMPMVSCIDDLDFFKDFENEFPAIVYNDALTSKSDFSTEPTLCPQYINEFDLKDETSLSKYDEVEQNVLYFNDLFPFNIIYPGDLKSDKDNDDNEINMIQSSGGNENTQGSNKLLEASHDKINKVFIMKSFVMKLNVNIVAWNYFVNGMLFNLIKNLYEPFGIPFDPKRYYKDGDPTRMLRRPRSSYDVSISEYAVSTLRTECLNSYTYLVDFAYAPVTTTLAKVLDFEVMPELMRDVLYARMRMEHRDGDGVVVFTSQAWGRVFETRGPLGRRWSPRFCQILEESVVRDPSAIDEWHIVYAGEEDSFVKLIDTWAWVPAGPARQEGDAGGVAEEAPVAPRGGDEEEEMPQAVPPQPKTQ
ncbi:hypothetical protein Tco_0487180 [Tanacetum coccineum]